jgi:hypothetical protein
LGSVKKLANDVVIHVEKDALILLHEIELALPLSSPCLAWVESQSSMCAAAWRLTAAQTAESARLHALREGKEVRMQPLGNGNKELSGNSLKSFKCIPIRSRQSIEAHRRGHFVQSRVFFSQTVLFQLTLNLAHGKCLKWRRGGVIDSIVKHVSFLVPCARLSPD